MKKPYKKSLFQYRDQRGCSSIIRTDLGSSGSRDERTQQQEDHKEGDTIETGDSMFLRLPSQEEGNYAAMIFATIQDKKH